MSKIYLLDRNAVSIIKDSNCGKPQEGKKLELLKKIKSLDNKKFIFSPLLSIFEGQHGRRETRDEITQTIAKESSHIGRFFKNARTDCDFLRENNLLISNLISGERELNFDGYIGFLNYAKEYIYQPLPEEKKYEVLEELVKEASHFGVPLGHPVFVCCAATIFGCSVARKVLKPKVKNYNAHNALSDLILISRINNIKSLMVNDRVKFKFVTLDVALEKFISMVSVVSVSPINNGCLQYLSYSQELFPDLGESDYQRLMERLGGVVD